MKISSFEYLKALLIEKKQLPLDTYSPYIITKLLSYLYPDKDDIFLLLNSNYIITDKTLHYKLCLTLFPKLKKIPPINYRKKKEKQIQKDENKEKEKEKEINYLTTSLEISQKELRHLQLLYKQLFPKKEKHFL